MNTSINEVNNMTDSEKRYRIYERMEEMYLSNMDYKQALASKWAMLANQGGNH